MALVRYKGKLEQLVGRSEEKVDCRSTKDLHAYIRRTYGKEVARALKSCILVVNGERVNHGCRLTEMDEVMLIPVCGGG